MALSKAPRDASGLAKMPRNIPADSRLSNQNFNLVMSKSLVCQVEGIHKQTSLIRNLCLYMATHLFDLAHTRHILAH